MNLYKYSLIQHKLEQARIHPEHQNSPKQTRIQTETKQGGQCIGLSTGTKYSGWNGTENIEQRDMKEASGGGVWQGF